MIADAHVHIGWFNCPNKSGLKYYSPRRVIGVLDRCGVDAFIVSSTSAQAPGITLNGLYDEAREVEHLAGNRARQFLWVSRNVLLADPALSLLDTGMYCGIKLHEQEGRWVQHHPSDLRRILDVVLARGLCVQFHSGPDRYCSPSALMAYARRYPDVKFDFAHCSPMDEMASVIAQCDNVWTDTAYMRVDQFEHLRQFNWHKRLMYGSDFPVRQAYQCVSFTADYRNEVKEMLRIGMSKDMDDAFNSFLSIK